MSTMTTTASNSSTSAPHPPSSSSVVTGLKASLGSGTFFHAHLQEGQRFEYSAPASVHYEVSAFAIGPNGILSSGSYPRKPNKTSTCEEPPRVSQRHAAEKAASGAGASSSSSSSAPTSLHPQASLSHSPAKKWSRSASATPMSSDNRDFWTMVADAQAAVSGTTPASRRYHYITRSQSADAAADAGHLQPAPKMHKQNASYSPGFGTPVYQETVENMPIASTAPVAWCPTRGRYLSPIEEVQFFPEKQGDAASLHSTTSAQSNLFIHRSVRRTPSTSTFNSGHSTASRSPDDPITPHGTNPSRVHGQSRPFPALPVIPASPRESQNVFEPDPVPLEEASLAYPMPVVYPPQVEYSAFQPPEEEDLGDPLPPPRFAVPHYRSDFDFPMEEQDLGEALPPRVSIPHSRTPSLLSRSESVRTELTYLTAQDSAAASRRASAMLPDDLDTGKQQRSPFADGDTTLVDTPAKTASPAARLKASFETLLSKSPIARKPPGGGLDHTAPDAGSTFSISPKAAKWLSHVHEGLKKRAPWGEGAGKPAEVLFWTGFLAPWCWLIGGWMLAHSGETMAEGLPSGAKEPGLPLHSASSLHLQLREQRSREMAGLPVNVSAEKHSTEPTSIWQAAKNSSAELIESLRGHKTQENSRSNQHTLQLQLQGDVPMMFSTRLDPWVTRCRVAAVVSGMFILALCIVALIVLVRSL